MEKLLICIPVVCNAVVFSECLEQILYKRNIHIIIQDNNASEDVKERLEHYRQYPQVEVWVKDKNQYVVPAWNDFIEHFLVQKKWDRLIILNSDLTLNKFWWDKCQTIWSINPEYVIIPNVINDKTKMYEEVGSEYSAVINIPDGKGIPGVFVTLNRNQAQTVYPLPPCLKIWYSDTWIMELVAAADFPISIFEGLLAFHHVSTSIHRVPEALQVIEEDKIAFEETVKPALEAIIKLFKNN